MNRLGVALLPDPESYEYIFSVVDMIKELKIPYLKWNEENTPHMTLFQGKFLEPSVVVKEIDKILLDNSLKTQKVQGFGVWAFEWLFLEFEKHHKLVELHYNVVNNLIKRRLGKAVDFLDEEAMTAGQKKSFSETGYQFTYNEFNPHVTLFQLVPKQKDSVALIKKLNKVKVQNIVFNRFVVYRTGSGGACTDRLLEKRL
jgi:2'-5' RNA ligase